MTAINRDLAARVAELGIPLTADYPVLRNSSVIPLPARWSCAYGVSDDEPFCTDEGDEHVCPTIRVHRDDANAFAALVARVHELEGERDRFKAAWASARFRAQAYGEGIQRVVKDREQYQVWLKQAEAARLFKIPVPEWVETVRRVADGGAR
jgi:hypothetical protein